MIGPEAPCRPQTSGALPVPFSVLSTEALPPKELETPLNASATAGCQEQNSSPMVIGTIFEVGRSGLEVAGLINTAERILSALFSTGSKNGRSKIFMRASTARSAGALEGSGVASRDCKTNGERDQCGSSGYRPAKPARSGPVWLRRP